jgi:hypothetical protein
MFWLGLIGLGITALGGIFGMIGQAQANEQQIKVDELEAQQLKESQQIYASQQKEAQYELTDIRADVATAGTMNTLAMMDLGEQAAAAKGSIQATAGVGNIAGESVLRRANRVETLYRREALKTKLSYEDTMRGLESRRLGAETSLLTAGLQYKWAGEKAKQSQEQADWLRDYGWMSVLATGLNAGANIVGGAQSIDWSKAPWAKQGA